MRVFGLTMSSFRQRPIVNQAHVGYFHGDSLICSSTPKFTPSDPARGLLSQYVALKCTILPEESLQSLVAKGDGFMIDVTRKLARRLSISGTATRSFEDHIEELE